MTFSQKGHGTHATNSPLSGDFLPDFFLPIFFYLYLDILYNSLEFIPVFRLHNNHCEISTRTHIFKWLLVINIYHSKYIIYSLFKIVSGIKKIPLPSGIKVI